MHLNEKRQKQQEYADVPFFDAKNDRQTGPEAFFTFMIRRLRMTTAPVYIFHNTEVMSRHIPASPAFPENPARLLTAEHVLKSRGLWDACETVAATIPLSRQTLVDVYGEARVAKMEAHVRRAIRDERPVSDGDIYWSADTLEAARVAAAAAVMATQTVLESGGSAFALIRPPGHHCFTMPAGFCILNNIVFAAREAKKAGKKVAIVDWDYHFGDGTAQMVMSEEDVMFVSLHCMRDSDGRATYPISQLKAGELAKRTHGRCFNVAWQRDDADDAAMAFAFQRLILPALERFAPDVILISAGYDALKGDDLAGMELTPPVFRTVTLALRTLSCPVVGILEGGYNLELLAEGICETVQGMLDAPDREKMAELATTVSTSHRVQVETIAEHLRMCQTAAKMD